MTRRPDIFLVLFLGGLAAVFLLYLQWDEIRAKTIRMALGAVPVQAQIYAFAIQAFGPLALFVGAFKVDKYGVRARNGRFISPALFVAAALLLALFEILWWNPRLVAAIATELTNWATSGMAQALALMTVGWVAALVSAALAIALPLGLKVGRLGRSAKRLT